LWDLENDCKNYNVLSGHKNAVLQVCWPTVNSIVSCSADKTVACWDSNKGMRTRKYLEHSAVVNACAVARDAPYMIASGSDDCTAILWDSRSRRSVGSLYHDYQVCAVALAHDATSVYTGGIDNVVRKFDLRMGMSNGGSWESKAARASLETPEFTLTGHSDTITGLSVSPDGNQLLSNSMDSTLRVWDIRPFAAGGATSDARCENVLTGVHHGAEKVLLRCSWSADQEHVAAGSADRCAHVVCVLRYFVLNSMLHKCFFVVKISVTCVI
jgi:Prp8 binding protein